MMAEVDDGEAEEGEAATVTMMEEASLSSLQTVASSNVSHASDASGKGEGIGQNVESGVVKSISPIKEV